MYSVIPGREPCDKIDASINFVLGERTRNLEIPGLVLRTIPE